VEQAGVQEYTLLHPKVIAARERFEKIKHRKCRLGFDDLFVAFSTDCYRFTAISEEAGVSQQRITQIYEQYFQQFFGKTGLKRWNACTLRRHSIKVDELLAEEDDPAIKDVSERATAYGCMVERVVYRAAAGLHLKSLKINGRLCKLLRSRSSYVTNPRRPNSQYAHAIILEESMRECEAVIWWVNVPNHREQVFILPASMVQSAIKTVDRYGKPQYKLWLPMYARTSKRGPQAKIDFKVYEDAWHLLRDKE
jgi:hypothetical protein